MDLFERARSGEPEAVRTLVDSLRPRITRMAAYYSRRSGQDAEDLLQEAWLGLVEALPALDPGIGSPEQHLIRRARWRLLDAIKRGRRVHQGGWAFVPLEAAADLPEDPASAARAEGVACTRAFIPL